MDTTEKKEQLQCQLKDLQERISSVRSMIRSDAGEQEKELSASVDEANARIKAFNEKTISRLEDEINEFSRNADVARMVLEIQAKEDTADLRGDLEAAKENVTLAKEYGDGKRNAALLKAQMDVNEYKARLAEHLAEMDKEDRAFYINNLLDYADDCSQLAEAYLLEADLALAEANAEIDSYEKDYGESVHK